MIRATARSAGLSRSGTPENEISKKKKNRNTETGNFQGWGGGAWEYRTGRPPRYESVPLGRSLFCIIRIIELHRLCFPSAPGYTPSEQLSCAIRSIRQRSKTIFMGNTTRTVHLDRSNRREEVPLRSGISREDLRSSTARGATHTPSYAPLCTGLASFACRTRC